MSHRQSMEALVQSGQARPARQYTQQELLEIAAEAFDRKGTATFKPLYGVEHMKLKRLRALSTDDTVLQPMIEAWNDAGVPTDNTVGNLMALLGWERQQVDDFACYCFHGDKVSAVVAAKRLRNVAAGLQPFAING